MSFTRTQVNEALNTLGLKGTGVVELKLDHRTVQVTRYQRDNTGKIVLDYTNGANLTLITTRHEIINDEES